MCWGAACGEKSNHANAVSLQQLEFFVPKTSKGTKRVQIQVGDSRSTPPIQVILARIGQYGPVQWAIGVLVGLVIMIWLLLGLPKKGPQVAGQKKRLLSALLLDSSTGTYSFSKTQFFCCTAPAVFRYPYFTIPRSLAHGF